MCRPKCERILTASCRVSWTNDSNSLLASVCLSVIAHSSFLVTCFVLVMSNSKALERKGSADETAYHSVLFAFPLTLGSPKSPPAGLEQHQLPRPHPECTIILFSPTNHRTVSHDQSPIAILRLKERETRLLLARVYFLY